MKPFIKYALIGMGGLAAIAAIGMAFIAASFDANKFKADISRLVKDRTQRTLVIDGAIKLAFFPKLGVEIGRFSLSESKGNAVFAEVNSARASVELLPLLSKQIVVDRVVIDGLRATLTRQKDGSSNFDDLFGRPAAAARSSDTAAPALRLEIAGIDIRNTDLQWTDEAKNQQFAIRSLSFKTGRLGSAARSKFELALHLASRQPALDLQIAAGGNMSLDPAAKRYRVANLAASVSGRAAEFVLDKLEVHGTADFNNDATSLEGLQVKLAGKRGGEGVDATLDVAKAQLAGHAVRAEKLSLVFKLTASSSNINVILAVPAMQGTGKAFKAADFALDLDGKKGENSFKGRLASPISANVEAGRYQLPKLSGSVEVAGPGLPKGAIAVKLNGDAAVDFDRKTAQLSLAAKFDQSSIDARFGLTRFSPPALGFDLSIDRLDLDQYLSTESGRQTASAHEVPIALAPLKAVNANGSIRIGALQASKLKASDLNAKVRLSNGRLEMSPLAAKLYQGSMTGTLIMDANGNRYALKEALNAISIGPLLRDLADKDVLEGRGNLSLDLSSSGNTVSALKKALDGTARIELKDGAIKGINLAATMRKARSALSAKGAAEQGANTQEKTDFSELAASFVIRNGVAHNEDLMLKSPFLRVTGRGDVNIGGESIDYLAKATVVSTAAGQGGKNMAELKGLTVPVRLSGPYDALKYSVDFGAMASEAAKEKVQDAVSKAIGEKFGSGAAKPGGQNSDPADQARKALKGLFSR